MGCEISACSELSNKHASSETCHLNKGTWNLELGRELEFIRGTLNSAYLQLHNEYYFETEYNPNYIYHIGMT